MGISLASIAFPMAAFALAASISPGPVEHRLFE